MRAFLFSLLIVLQAAESTGSEKLGMGLDSLMSFISSPDFSDEGYWTNRHIGIARVTSLRHEANDVKVELKILLTLDCFSGDDGTAARLVAKADEFCLPPVTIRMFLSMKDGVLKLLVSFDPQGGVGREEGRHFWLDAEVLHDGKVPVPKTRMFANN